MNEINEWNETNVTGTLKWRVATPPSRDDWAIIRHLEPGRKYDIQVITRSDFGESSGVIQVIVAGADSGQSLRHSALFPCALATITVH